MIAYLKKNYSGCRIKFMFRFFFALIGQFSPVYNYIHGRLSESFSGSQAVFGTTFRFTGGFWKPGSRFLRRGLLERFSQVVSDFIKANRNFKLGFLRKKTTKIVKTISAHSTSTVLIFWTIKEIFISCHYPLYYVIWPRDPAISRRSSASF